jgi:hypothetical protein
MGSEKDALEGAKRIMGALVHMPPRPHDEMKLGKPRGKPSKSLKAKKAPPKRGQLGDSHSPSP